MKSYLKPLLFTWLIVTSLTSLAQPPTFDQYKATIYKGHPAALVIKGNALAEQFRTVIRTTYYSTKEQVVYHGSTGLNFGGHYCFVYWGCGSPCQYSAVVDLKTGIVYPGINASLGYEFKPDSRLVVVNPGVAEPDCSYCKNEYWFGVNKKRRSGRCNSNVMVLLAAGFVSLRHPFTALVFLKDELYLSLHINTNGTYNLWLQ